MRKFFAATLAAAMTLSMAATSFAATSATTVLELAGPYRYDSDDNFMADVNRVDGSGKAEDTVRYGGAAYYAIKIDDGSGSQLQQKYKNIEKLKVKAEFEMGEDIVNSIGIVKKYVDKAASVAKGVSVFSADGYYYFVEMKINSKDTVSETDVIGTFEFNRKADSDLGTVKINDEEEDFSFTVAYKDNWNINTTSAMIKGDVNLNYDTNYALKFDNDDEVTLSFGKSNGGYNEGEFTVDVSGQGKIFFKYNTKANEAIVNANPGVKMFFLNFNNAKFNRVGEFVYEMDDIAAAYKVVGDKLVEIKGLELDSDSATFNTRVLESYVFADAELVNPTVEVEAPVVEAPVVEAPVTNPSTGANA